MSSNKEWKRNQFMNETAPYIVGSGIGLIATIFFIMTEISVFSWFSLLICFGCEISLIAFLFALSGVEKGK